MRPVLLALCALTVFGGFGEEIYPTAFSCTGKIEGDLCWLTDARMYSTASWEFAGITPGQWTLVLQAESRDLCSECCCERDTTVQLLWREAVGEQWNWRFVVLRPEESGACRVRAEIPLRLGGPRLWVLVRRAILCEPFLGFSRSSAYLRPPAVVEAPLPPPPEITPPPVTPPPPPAKLCQIGPFFACTAGELPPECVPPDLDLEKVARAPLADTYGPEDAQTLSFGHYAGEMPSNDYQDWYKFSLAKGEGGIVYFVTFGDLEVDLHLVHDPCGTDLGVCLSVKRSAVLYAPCQAGVECVTIPDGLTECFRGERCGFFIRIVWRSGSGKYYLSILPAEVTP
ncbi:MAG: hypothetical protein NZ651_02775 [Candidatus Bipolaricaulota bacterium]|nr:hypothetical protein [Candidatus Bipolaricaulota bacterium]MDW8126681.1 hypothetical protein [Candidatus Bipolaricaulota bacterium]